MFNRLNNNRGFTFIELLVVTTVLGILIAIAVPKIISLRDDAFNAVSEAVIGNVNSGIALYFLTKGEFKYPEKLDDAQVGDSPEIKPYFDVVLQRGIRDTKWSKIGTIYTYRAPNDSLYTYDPETGSIK